MEIRAERLLPRSAEEARAQNSTPKKADDADEPAANEQAQNAIEKAPTIEVHQGKQVEPVPVFNRVPTHRATNRAALVSTPPADAERGNPQLAEAAVVVPLLARTPEADAEHTAPPPASEPLCRAQLREGNSAQAIACFEQLARGSGLQAEVATYEIARVSAATGRDPIQVLSLLDQYQERFPSGVMRGEVDWLRVQSLYRAGRHRAALSESEALLSTPAGRVLAAEVHWLRGIIYEERLLDFARAASEFVTFVGVTGARADQGEWRRARCLERLGRRADAIEAYRRYLARSGPQHAAEARRKLADLGASPGGELPNTLD